MSKVRNCFGRRTGTMWVPTTTTRARKCVFLLGQVRRKLFPRSSRKHIVAHSSGIIPREQARPVHLLPCRTQGGQITGPVSSAPRDEATLADGVPSMCGVPRDSSYHRPCEEGCSGPFAYGERYVDRTERNPRREARGTHISTFRRL